MDHLSLNLHWAIGELAATTGGGRVLVSHRDNSTLYESVPTVDPSDPSFVESPDAALAALSTRELLTRLSRSALHDPHSRLRAASGASRHIRAVEGVVYTSRFRHEGETFALAHAALTNTGHPGLTASLSRATIGKEGSTASARIVVVNGEVNTTEITLDDPARKQSIRNLSNYFDRSSPALIRLLLGPLSSPEQIDACIANVEGTLKPECVPHSQVIMSLVRQHASTLLAEAAETMGKRQRYRLMQRMLGQLASVMPDNTNKNMN